MARPPLFSDHRRLQLGVAALGLLAVGGISAVALHQWVRKLPLPGLETAAQTAWKTGDPANASLAARRILEVDNNNRVANRVMAEMASKAESPEAVFWWKRVVELSPEDREAWEKMILAHIGRSEWPDASEALDRSEKLFPGLVGWSRLRCTLAAARGDLKEAVTRFRELKGADESPALRLALHSLEAIQGDVEARQRGLAGLALLAGEKHPQALKAASSLLKLAEGRGDQEERAKWARRILDDPEASPDLKLDALDHWARAGKDWKPDLVRLREEAQRTARGTHRLLSWLNTRRELAEARTLIDSVPPGWLGAPPLSLSVGETLLLQGDWPALRRFLDSCSWSEKDPFRRLLELRWRKEQTNLNGDSTYETEAMTYARETARIPKDIERVLELVRLWRWDDLRTLLLRERARTWPQSELPTLNELFEIYRVKRDLRGQFYVMARILEIQPGEPVVTNNVAYLRLLLDEDTEQGHRLAAQVFEGNPKTQAFHSTYALSLVLKKQAGQALELFQELKPETAARTEIRYAHALSLAAAGRVAEGAKHLEGLPLETFAEEEWLLLERYGLHRPASK